MRGRPPLKDYVQIPECPFCGMNIERPQEVEATANSPGMPVGSCTCGAVYAFDVSGRNLGSAFIEALVFACNMDWDMAWGLLPDKDYREEIVKNYDPQNHLIIPGGFFEGRKIVGALYFIKLNSRGAGVLPDGPPVSCISIKKEKEAGLNFIERKKVSKKELEAWVKQYRVENVLRAAHQDHKILWLLRRLLCASDPLLRLRAAELMGRAAKVIALENPGIVSELLKALINSLADSGASIWATLDAVGEIMGNSIDKFSGYLPALLALVHEEHLQVDALRALHRIACANPELLRKFSSLFTPLLWHNKPESRGYAVLILGALGETGIRKELESLRGDGSEIVLYESGQLIKKAVGRLAEDVLRGMNQL
ncbi:DVU0298 family protein [Desulfofundulus thermosubterraneus]|uniref:PBS lyase n=1 Tax=Desulfofundulus thermosubterraneus DSM 16057 TaxID=1121432 RepID=A0A1M6DA58_9FIRM|nr:DVU0298 family protein [Desulfofundulus thermosubterraneus]SHI70045.1 hypothetical protein SAMN02745219_00877 [Desulfofundulus thermosubterraneus DSM 16057]